MVMFNMCGYCYEGLEEPYVKINYNNEGRNIDKKASWFQWDMGLR